MTRAVFEGADAAGLDGLWVTDGTALGTYEITGITGANTKPGVGFQPFGFTPFNGEVLFSGVDAAGQRGLWVTDGTAASTHEVTGITGTFSGGLFPGGFTVFNGKVLFSGSDAAGQIGLWVTDGTASGTQELTGITGANTSAPFGFAPGNFTVFNGEVLFSGTDVGGNSGLWVTDGTAGGTHELTGITGASTSGLTSGLLPGSFVVFNGEVLFEGLNAANKRGLWVTDGTAAGTHELTGITGASTSGLQPSGLIILNGQVLFAGFDAASQSGLWVTDGTAGGTHELTGITGANAVVGVAPNFLFPNASAVLNGKLLFQGRDTADLQALFVTDGTVAGTHDISGIAGANTFFGLAPGEFTALNGEVLLSGLDTSNDPNLWVTDGTAGGTHELTGINGASASGLGPHDILALPDVPFDLNGDGNSDLVFQNNGQAGVWLMNGTTPIAEAGLGNPGASWRIVTSRDVNGDGKADLIWQNSDGTPGIWLMNGTTPIAEAGFSNPGPSWHIEAAGDLNGDGKADLVWQNSDGTLGVWLMNGTTPGAEAAIGNPGANWKVVGTADYNADGRDDILLQDTTTGNLMIDLMNGTSIASTVSLTVGDPSWHAVSTGVFNGQAEIAWQNSNGTPAIWVTNGTAPVAEAALPNPGAAWQVLSIDHFTPDGHGDLLFQNTNGTMGMWEMNGTNIVAEVGLPSSGGWQSVNGHPFTAG